MIARLREWWQLREAREKVFLCGTTGVACLILLPLVVGFALPFVALSMLLGYGFLRGSFVSASIRNYARVAICIPLAAVAIAGLLTWVEPRPESPDRDVSSPRELQQQLSRVGRNSRMRVAPKLQETAKPDRGIVDSWVGRVNDFYTSWYDRYPLIGPVSRTRFSFDSFRWMLLSAALLGAPLFFWLIHEQDAERAWQELNRKRDREFEEFKQSYREKHRELERMEAEFELAREGGRRAVAVRDQEIERLRQRQKYLTEGKPGPLEVTPGRPDLDYL